MNLEVDLVKRSLMRLKLTGLKYELPEYNHRSIVSAAKSFRLVHKGRLYFISIGFKIFETETEPVSKKVVRRVKLFVKWHLHQPTTENYVENANSIPIKNWVIGEKYDEDAIWYLHYPATLWAEVAGQFSEFGRKKDLLELVTWESSTSICRPNGVSLANSVAVDVSCFIWIKFHHHGGEKKSLKVFKDMFASQTNCDVQFCFDGGEQIGGHASILGARSGVFAAMFQNGMLESKTKQVAIREFGFEIFKEFLHYIYARQILSNFTEIKAKSLFLLADKYDIKDLKEECLHFLQSGICTKNAIDLLVWAHLHSADEMKEAVLSSMHFYGNFIIELQQWEILTKEYPELSVLAARRMQRYTTIQKKDAFEILGMLW